MTGIRINELDMLTYDDILVYEDNDDISIKITKGLKHPSNSRTIEIKEDEFGYIVESLMFILGQHHQGDSYLFSGSKEPSPNTTSAFKKLSKEINLNFGDNIIDTTKPFYSFRHSFISNRLREGKDINMLAKFCGTSIEMIEEHYDHVKNLTLMVENKDFRAIHVTPPSIVFRHIRSNNWSIPRNLVFPSKINGSSFEAYKDFIEGGVEFKKWEALIREYDERMKTKEVGHLMENYEMIEENSVNMKWQEPI